MGKEHFPKTIVLRIKRKEKRREEILASQEHGYQCIY